MIDEQSGVCHFCGEAGAQYWSGPDGWACAVCSDNEIAALQCDPIPHLRVTLAIADLIRYHSYYVCPDGLAGFSSWRFCQAFPVDTHILPAIYGSIDEIDERIKGERCTVTFTRRGIGDEEYAAPEDTWEDIPTVEWPTLPHEDEPIAIFHADEDWYYFQGDYTGDYYMSKEPTKDTAKQEGVYMAHWEIHRKCIELTVEGQMRYELDTTAEDSNG